MPKTCLSLSHKAKGYDVKKIKILGPEDINQ